MTQQPTSKPPTPSTSAKGQEPGRGAGSIEEAHAKLIRFSWLTPSERRDISADGIALALAVLKEAMDGMAVVYVEQEQQLRALRARIKALGERKKREV